MQTWRKKLAGGFTLIELMIVVAIIGILAAVAIPAFVRYMRKAKTVEATESLDKIKQGARSYYQSERYSANAVLEKKQFPGANNATAESGKTNAFALCCANGTAKCDPATDDDWTGTWLGLKFALNEPHYFAYQFLSTGLTKEAEYTSSAVGDLDCDGTSSLYKIQGTIDTEGSVVTKGPMVTSEIE